MNIAFCDDDELIRGHIRQTICDLFAAASVPVQPQEYGCIRELSDLSDFHPDLLFLDIDLPDGDGVQLGEQLRQAGVNIPIVFVSNMDERVYDVFGIQPFGFLRKSRFDQDAPSLVDRFLAAAEKAETRLLLTDEDGKTVSLPQQDILYIESAGKLQKVFLSGQPDPVPVRAVLRELDLQLESAGFIRIHKGFLANYRFIQKITSRAVLLDDGTTLPIGRDRLQEVRERYLRLMKKKSLL